MRVSRPISPPSFLDDATISRREVLSGVSGSISLAAWICLLAPQLIENYRRGSADALSMSFVVVWFLGDVTNLLGSLEAGLVPTVIALAAYFCLADIVLLAQCLYYGYVNGRSLTEEVLTRPNHHGSDALRVETNDDVVRYADEPLLGPTTSDGHPRPPSRRRSSTSAPHADHPRRQGKPLPLVGLVANEPSRAEDTRRSIFSVILVCFAGAAGWWLAWTIGVWVPASGSHHPGSNVDHSVGPQVLGYFSAVCYLGARIPQMIKNYQLKSCRGLSLLFFILSVLGNISYGASLIIAWLQILFHSLDKDYLIVNAPWLVGSLGTIVEDIIIFVQFYHYYYRELYDTVID